MLRGRVFLAAFPVSRRPDVPWKNAQRMGNNHSRHDHSLRCPYCGGMDRLGFGFHGAAPTRHWGTVRELKKAN
jgi:hypothetical protein